MIASERSISLVAEFLTRHRAIPPERDGWFSIYEIESGIRNELASRIRPAQVAVALDLLLEVVPPAIEDAWIQPGTDKLPDLEDFRIFPDSTDKYTRRFYRALGNAHNYVNTTVIAGAGVNPILQ